MGFLSPTLASRHFLLGDIAKHVLKLSLTSSRLQELTMKETKHLSQGSTQPPLTRGSLRIYNMRFCPYAQRSLLVAEAKQIQYDVVNVNLTTKPDWFLALNPRGQVPTLEFEDGDWLGESLVISDFLDDDAPDSRPLYPKGSRAKAKDRLLVDRFNRAIAQMKKAILSGGDSEQHVSFFEKLAKELDKFEKELKTRRTVFFCGSSPGMVDYMIWPWFERGILRLGGSTVDGGERFATLAGWCDAMREDPAVQKWLLAPEVHARFMASLFDRKPDFDLLVSPTSKL